MPVGFPTGEFGFVEFGNQRRVIQPALKIADDVSLAISEDG